MTPRRPAGGFWSGTYRVAMRNFLVWRRYASASAIGNFGEPILYLLALGFGLGRVVPDLGDMTYAEFIAPGLVVSTVMYTATFECTFGAYTRLETQRTYDAVLATPITVGELVAGELLWTGIKTTIGAAIVLLVITAFGLVASPLALFVLPLSLGAGLLFGAIALTVTTLSKSYEFFSYYMTLVAAPMFLFSGVFFPLERMPHSVEIGAQVLPMTHVVTIARQLVRGALDRAALGHLAVIVALLAVFYALCQSRMRRRMAY